MHDRALLRVVKARRAIGRSKFNYNIWHMAELGVQIGRHENNNERYWFHPKYNPHGESRTGDLPWSLALPPKHLGCRNMFEAYLTIDVIKLAVLKLAIAIYATRGRLLFVIHMIHVFFSAGVLLSANANLG